MCIHHTVSTCKESLNNECHAYKACILGEMVAGSVATAFLSIFTVGLAAIPGAIVTAGASAASWAAFYNGESRVWFTFRVALLSFKDINLTPPCHL